MSPSVSVCIYSPPRVSCGERGEREKGSRKISGKDFERGHVPAPLPVTHHSHICTQQAVQRAQQKHPAQGAALIGLAPVSRAFFCGSSGICIMSEVGVEMILPSSALTKALQSSNSWVMCFKEARMPYKCKMSWALSRRHSPKSI